MTEKRSQLRCVMIEYLIANPGVCEIQASVSKNGAGIESVNVFVKDEKNAQLDTFWQEFRQGDKVITDCEPFTATQMAAACTIAAKRANSEYQRKTLLAAAEFFRAVSDGATR
jgi:hypothetical protein